MKLPRLLPVSFSVLLATAAAFGQYKSESAGAPPDAVSPALAGVLQKTGTKITSNGSPYAEIWVRSSLPQTSKTAEENVTLSGVPQGTLMAVIRFDTKATDRRGQSIQPGVYTMRYGLMPVNGDHQGAAPQRDFLLLVPAADDKDANSTPDFNTLVAMSKKASGTPHPAVFSFWKADSDFKAGFDKQGDTDWVLQTKVGETPVAIILIGVAAG